MLILFITIEDPPEIAPTLGCIAARTEFLRCMEEFRRKQEAEAIEQMYQPLPTDAA